MFVLEYSCSRQFEPKEGAYPLYDYRLLINIQDALGNEKLMGLPYIPGKDSQFAFGDEGIFFKVHPEYCTWEVIMPGPCVKTESGLLISTFEPKLVVGKMDDEHYYLFFKENSFNRCPRVGVITHKLICPLLFGDEKEHIIVSYWKSSENYKMPSESTCYHITIDGNEIPVTQKKFFEGYNEEYKVETGCFFSIGWAILDK